MPGPPPAAAGDNNRSGTDTVTVTLTLGTVTSAVASSCEGVGWLSAVHEVAPGLLTRGQGDVTMRDHGAVQYSTVQ